MMLARHLFRNLRALLIGALLALWASVGLTANVQASAMPEHHHAQMDHGESHGSEEDDSERGDHPVAHVCVGCAVAGQSALVETNGPLPAVPAFAGVQPSMRPFQSNPIPPPPRQS